jgi:ammonium transporter, Amt family
MVGLVFNGLFAADYIIGLNGVSTGLITGGWLNHNWKQLYIQLAYIIACTAYSFIVSAVIAFGVNLVPGLKLRASEKAELLGMDDDQLGEFAYDYEEVRRDYLAWTPERGDSGVEVGNGNAKNERGLESNMSESALIVGQNIKMSKASNGDLRSRVVTPASQNRL